VKLQMPATHCEKSITKEVGGHGSLGLVDNAGKGVQRRKVCVRRLILSPSRFRTQRRSIRELCYASIKRVHRDQTICPISEQEVASRPKTVNDFEALRSQNKDLYLAPLKEKKLSASGKETR
jgi:hypothetical protein